MKKLSFVTMVAYFWYVTHIAVITVQSKKCGCSLKKYFGVNVCSIRVVNQNSTMKNSFHNNA